MTSLICGIKTNKATEKNPKPNTTKLMEKEIRYVVTQGRGVGEEGIE